MAKTGGKSEARSDAASVALRSSLAAATPRWISSAAPASYTLTEATTEFMSFFTAELARIDAFVRMYVAELKFSLSAQLRRPTIDLAMLTHVEQQLCAIDRFIAVNMTGFRRVARLADTAAGGQSSLYPLLYASIAASSSFNIDLGPILLGLSDAYAAARASAADKKKSDWVPPESFSRNTDKYLVRLENLLQVKCHIVRHLPVLIFGRGSSATGDFDVSDSSLITSVYFDNDQLDVYHGRLAREEGETLVRTRWYGEAPADGSDTPIFVERKTHHESWVAESSIKERFPLQANLLSRYVSGRWTLDAAQKRLRRTMGDREVEKALALASEIQNDVVTRGLRPAVRTMYRRSAFQLSSSNDVRISIDTDLNLIDETQLTYGELEWSPDLLSRATASSVVSFPFAVLEIKLAADVPVPWVDELLATGLLIEAPKFSKFLSATALHQEGKCKQLPAWWELIAQVKDPNDRTRGGALDAAYLSDGEESDDETIASIAATRAVAKGDHRRSRRASRAGKRASTSVSPSPRAAPATGGPGGSTPLPPAPSTAPEHSVTALPAFKPKPLKVPVKIEPKTFFANERTFLQWINTVVIMAVVSTSFVSFGNAAAQQVGLILVVISLLFAFYALIVFHWRRRAIRARDVTTAYDDQFGPALLVVLLTVGMVFAMILPLTSTDTSDCIC